MTAAHSSILVPVDTSPLSEKALPQAIRLSKALGLPIRLFAVIDAVVANAVTEYAEAESIDIYEAVDAYFERLVTSLADQEVDVSFHHEPGVRPGDGILDYIEANDIDLVVMASHGYSGITRWLLGSVAEKVVRSAEVPILVVPVRES